VPSLPRIAPIRILLVAVFVDMLGYGLVIPLLPIAIAKLGGSATQVGVLIAGYALLQGVCGPLLGMLSDRFGRRPILLVCLLGSGIGYLILGIATSLELLLLALLIDAITGANLSTAQAYLADSTTGVERSQAFGLIGVAFGLGMTAGPALAGGLSGLGIGIPALVAAALALTNLLIMAFALPESLPADQRHQARFSLSIPRNLIHEGYALRGVLLPILAINLAFAGLQSIFPLFSQARFNWNTSTNGIFFAFVGSCAIITQAFVIGWLRQHMNDLQLVRLGTCLMLVLPLIGLVPASWMLYPLAALIALGSNLCIPALASMLAEHAQHYSHGRAMGLQQLVINTALTIGPLVAGLSYDQIGPAAPFVIAGLWAGAGLVVMLKHVSM
jgi:MFS transporter, DHA1 family, tetracycline resistance protein